MAGEDRESLHRFQEEGSRLLTAFQTAGEHLPPVSASSRLGSVEVRVDGSGEVETLEVASHWRREAEPAGLGPLVLATLTEAMNERASTLIVRLAEELEAPASTGSRRLDGAVPTDRVMASLPRGREAAAAAETADRELRAAGGLGAAVAELVESLTTAARQRFDATDDRGHVRVTANRQGELVEVYVDPDWLDSAHTVEVSRLLLHCVRESRRRATEAPSLEDVLQDSALGRVQQQLTGTGSAGARSAPGTGGQW